MIVLRPEKDHADIAALAPFIEVQKSLGGKATAYVCQNHACDAPTTDIATMLATLARASRKPR